MADEIPAGVLGPHPVTLDVRAFLVERSSSVTLVDTGLDPTGVSLDAALADAGATWADVADVVITHGHADHVGALSHVRSSAPGARVHAHPAEQFPDAEPLIDGGRVGDLRAVSTPGHTAGHLSLIDEATGVLLVGDCVGVMQGRLVPAPPQFTTDPERAHLSLRRLLDFRGAPMLFAHGPPLADPWPALEALAAAGH